MKEKFVPVPLKDEEKACIINKRHASHGKTRHENKRKAMI